LLFLIAGPYPELAASKGIAAQCIYHVSLRHSARSGSLYFALTSAMERPARVGRSIPSDGTMRPALVVFLQLRRGHRNVWIPAPFHERSSGGTSRGPTVARTRAQGAVAMGWLFYACEDRQGLLPADEPRRPRPLKSIMPEVRGPSIPSPSARRPPNAASRNSVRWLASSRDHQCDNRWQRFDTNRLTTLSASPMAV